MRLGKTYFYPIEVQFEDIDGGGVVHHPQYLKYYERARNQAGREEGFSHNDFIKEGFALAVVSAQIHYKKPAIVEQKLWIITRLISFTHTSLFLHQALLNEKPASLGEDFLSFTGVINTLEIRLACMDLHKKKACPIPIKIKEIFALKS